MPEAPTEKTRDFHAAAWRKWLMLTLPLFLVAFASSAWFGFARIMPILLGLLVVTLAYQRLVKRRSWRSILFGGHPPAAGG